MITRTLRGAGITDIKQLIHEHDLIIIALEEGNKNKCHKYLRAHIEDAFARMRSSEIFKSLD